MTQFDIEAAEKHMRDDASLAAAEGNRIIASGEGDADFLRAQRQFDEARIQFVLACMRAENAGIGRNELLAAGGHAIGLIWGSLLMGCVGVREREIVNGWLQRSLGQMISPGAATKTLMSVFEPNGEEKAN